MKTITSNTIDTTLTTGKPVFSPRGIQLRRNRINELNLMIWKYENQDSSFKKNENDSSTNNNSGNADYDGITSESHTKYIQEVQILEKELIEPQVTTYPRRVTEVCIGCTVNILMNGEKRQYDILGYGETDWKNNQLAYTAPLVIGILGKKPGYIGEIQLCGRSQKVEIVEVSPLKEASNYKL